jgi:hypothetical protein
MFDGADILKIADKHLKEKYVLGAVVPMANKNWAGPWDCAEFVSWCAYWSYKILLGVRPRDPMTGESYSGWWHEDVMREDLAMPIEQAFVTPGAILVRQPGAFGRKIGHVAISRGDGTTIEAHSSAVGVKNIPNAASRPWTSGARLPGVLYTSGAPGAAYKLPKKLFMIKDPFMRGEEVKAIQRALEKKGVSPGKLDGVYGHLTAAAVASFQAMEGLVVDGTVGPQTAKALGL